MGKKSEISELILIRHGETDWNAKLKVMGRQPVPLNDTGRAQAERLALRLKDAGLASIISSPVLRAFQTAEIIASRQTDVAVEKDDALSEPDFGDWVNMDIKDLPVKYPKLWHDYRRDARDIEFPGGETMREIAARVNDFIDGLLKRLSGGRISLVSHADTLKIALIRILGLDFSAFTKLSIDNCAVMRVKITPEDGPKLIAYNIESLFGRDM